MANSIFHGAPGSFKSASAFWFEVLPALRAGRLVVTNIEGVLPKEEIEIELDEVFPESAQVWRLSSQTDKGLFLWRRWFWWMPVGAFIIMDEIQDIFPKDATVFKPNDFDSKGIDSLKEQLPPKFYNYYKDVIGTFTPPDDEGSKDDTGETILDENGNIIYPKNMREANMRHRKYNWDIIYCTPEITEIHNLVRYACQYAYKYKYNDSLEFIPYFNRRTRYHEHSPKSSGETIVKGQPVKWRKIPVEVHKCYRSTSTGKITKRRGINGLKSPSLILAFALLLTCFSYMFWWLFVKPDRVNHFEESVSTAQETLEIRGSSGQQGYSSYSSSNTNKGISNNNVPIALPFGMDEIYISGQVQVITEKHRYRDYVFILKKSGRIFQVHSDELKLMGYTFRFVNSCSIKIYQGDAFQYVHCEPREIKPYKPPSDNNLFVSS
ncbi:MAG: zona occludens toxin-like protein [Colwellia sp.]|nr:zona occludens toxin-like protein [Colwellia sp.]